MKLPIPFGNPHTYPGHSGVDFPVPRGTVIPASGPGRVLSLGSSDRGGCYIWVVYDGRTRAVGYHHMDSHDGCPPAGTRVNEGTQLGYVGSLGKNSTGPHLHSEVSGLFTTAGYWSYFDPTRVVGSRPAGDGTTIHTEQDDDMSNMLITINDGHAKLGPAGKQYYALVTPAGTLDIVRDELASDLTWAFGSKKPDGTPSGNAYVLTYEEWDWFHKPIGVPA